MTDEELIERMAQELCIADWGVLRPEHIGSHYLGLARAILPLIREAELRGVKAGLEAAATTFDVQAIKQHELENGVTLPGLMASHCESTALRRAAATIRAIDPATVEIP